MKTFASADWNYLSLGLITAVVLTGCSSSGTSVTPVSATIQKQLIVDQQPTNISSLKAIYENLQPGQVVTAAGRIYAQGTSPFDAKESVFTIVELPKPGHNHEDPGDCPFCLRELQNSKIAIVRVVDPTGKPYPMSADKLLGLAKNKDIVVQGPASQIGDTLVIDLQSMHCLLPESAVELSTAFHAAAPTDLESNPSPSEPSS